MWIISECYDITQSLLVMIRMYKKGSARVQYKTATAELSYSRNERYCRVYSLQATDRRQGHATGLLSSLLALADRFDVTIELTAMASDHSKYNDTGIAPCLEQDELVRFYMHRGFEPVALGSHSVRFKYTPKQDNEILVF